MRKGDSSDIVVMEKASKKTTNFVLFVSGVMILSVIVFHNEILKFFVSAAYRLIEPPERNFCLHVEDDYQCITSRALQEKDADYCYYLDASRNDQCIDEFVAASVSPEECKNIRQRGSREYCLKRFKR